MMSWAAAEGAGTQLNLDQRDLDECEIIFSHFNERSDLFPATRLIWLSVKRRPVCQTCGMMSSASCTAKAEMCDAQAAACSDTPLGEQWLEMAVHWRKLANDGSPQGTLARLMSTGRHSRS
jgi:hypothetical protein